MRALTASIALCLAACATSTTSGKTEAGGKGAAAAQAEKLAVVNNIKFDVAACTAKPLDTPLNETLLTAALLSGRPAYSECLLDPKSRANAPDTQLEVKASATDAEVKFDVSGTNLDPSGKACIEKALTAMGLKPLVKGAKPIEMKIPYAFSAAQGVKWGVNDPSDIAGQVRIAQAQWCDCFAALGTTAPPNLQAGLHLFPDKPLEVAMAAKDADQPLANCLAEKLKALNPKATRELTVPYLFLLLNSKAKEETADAVPTLQFHQLDAIGQGQEVEVAMSVGNIELATTDFAASAGKYNAKPSSALMKDLREKCALILTRDEALKTALEGLKGTYERTQKVVASLKPSDPVWAQIETSVGERLKATTGQLGPAVEQKKNHSATCAKLK